MSHHVPANALSLVPPTVQIFDTLHILRRLLSGTSGTERYGTRREIGPAPGSSKWADLCTPSPLEWPVTLKTCCAQPLIRILAYTHFGHARRDETAIRTRQQRRAKPKWLAPSQCSPVISNFVPYLSVPEVTRRQDVAPSLAGIASLP